MDEPEHQRLEKLTVKNEENEYSSTNSDEAEREVFVSLDEMYSMDIDALE